MILILYKKKFLQKYEIFEIFAELGAKLLKPNLLLHKLSNTIILKPNKI